MAGNFTPKYGGFTVNMLVVTAAVEAGDPLKLGTNGVEEAGNGDTLFGIAMSDGAVGDLIAVWRPADGIFAAPAATGVNFALGDQAYLAANGELDAGSSGNKSCGVVVDFDPASGASEVRVAFDPWGTFTHA